MIDAAILPLKEHFSAIDDPRAQHSIEHLLLDIVLITICAVICGADNWVEIENYGIAKQEWLNTFLELPMARQLYWRVASITAFGVSPHLNFPRVNYKRFVSFIEIPIQLSIERRK
jgi:DDE_Tnp_1-associated